MTGTEAAELKQNLHNKSALKKHYWAKPQHPLIRKDLQGTHKNATVPAEAGILVYQNHVVLLSTRLHIYQQTL